MIADKEPYLRQEEASLPESWKVIALSKCVEILDHLRVPVNSVQRKARFGEVPYYGATGQVGWIDDYLFNEELLLIGEDGAPFHDKTKQIAYIVEGKSWVNNHAHVLRAIQNMTSNKYLKYYLDAFNFTDFVAGTTRLKLTQASLRKIPVLLPPKWEQERIVAKIEELLPKVNAVRERLMKVKEIMKRFRQSVLSAAFAGRLTGSFNGGNREPEGRAMDDLPLGWKIIELGHLIKGGPKNGLYKPQSFYGSGTPIVRIDNFYDGKITAWNDLKRLLLSKEELESFRLEEKDILVNRVNSMPFLGKSAIVRGLERECVFESNMMRIRVNQGEVSPDFLIKYLNSSLGLEELRKNAKHAVNQSSINQHDVKSVRVVLPPKPEQDRIARLIDVMFNVADSIEKQVGGVLFRTEKMIQAILGKAFRGELVP